MASEYTTHYNLDLYTDTDKPNLRDQYNGAMNKIDSQLNTLSNNIVISTEAANQAKEQAKAASDSAAANAQSISTLQNTVSGIDTAYKAADSSITAAYKAADTNMTERIDEEVSRAKAAEKANADSIAAETDRAKAAEKTNADAIANVKSAAYLDTTSTVVDNETLIPTSKAVYDFTSKTKEKKTILCFGDSYADTIDRSNSWAYALQTYFGWTVKNYAVSGAGWGVDVRTFYNQLQTAISKDGTDYNIDDVYALVLAGGRNDIMSNNEATSYVNTFMQAAKSHYKNAKIFIIPMLYDWQPLNASGRAKAEAIGNAASVYGAEVVNFAWEWLRGEKNCIQSGDIHPNAAGAKRIAGYINAALNGCYTPRYVSRSYTWSGAEVYCTAQGGMVTINIRGDFSSAPSGDRVLEEIFWPDTNYAGIGAVTSDGKPQLFFIQDNGSINVYNNTNVTGFVGLSMSYPW